MRHLLKISDLSKEEILEIIREAIDLKTYPSKYSGALSGQTLLMLFEKPSLRTRVSFETGMTQLGGHAIFYDVATSPLGKKENISDTAQVLSRYASFIMARVNKRSDVRELAQYATIPVINALDDFAHPCQMLGDMQILTEKKGSLNGLKLAYLGDCFNNVTYDLMRCGAVLGFHVAVAGPAGDGYAPEQEVIDECTALCAKSGGKVEVLHDAAAAVKDADAVYTDSWMSYHVPKDEMDSRVKTFEPFRVTKELMAQAKPDAVFMNCLPAARGMEQTAEVIDGPQSIVFDQAENRLHAQKALLLFLARHK